MTEPQPQIPPGTEAELAALADGRLDPDRRAAVEARVAADPALATALEQQRRALATIAAASITAPAGLRARLEGGRAGLLEDVDKAGLRARDDRRPGRVPRRRFRLRTWVPSAGLAGALAAVVAALVLAAGGGPGVDEVLAAAQRPATATPSYGYSSSGWDPAGWRETGSRTDVLDGRTMETVFYERGGRTIAYSVVDGAPLEGAPPQTVARGGRNAVVWVQGGHTCAVSGEGVSVATLAALTTT
jgi:anti-sigma factor RsiW